jgi:DNA-binding transcriptional regulator LsrR (DeoR family)
MMGVITPRLSSDRSEILDLSLGEDLAQAIAAQTQLSHPITVRVVRNFGHPDFESDPIAPVFVAYVAHRLVAQVLEQNLYARTIGIAGGNHVATFVRLIGFQSSPFPAGGDRPFKLLPLTLEPLHDHRLELADALVGEARGRAAPLLGDERIEALSFKPTGYVVEDKVVRTLDPESVLLMRENYHNMDVAIYGCGDGSDRNWLKSMGLILGLEPMPEVKTDVCLHMLSETGAPITLTEGSRRRDFPGVSLEQIRAVAARRGKLALLLVSGASKGLPIAIVARAGYCNAIVCDQAAARAALQALRGERAVG